MWTIPLVKVRGALVLRAAQISARKALYTALDLAGMEDVALRTAIRLAVCEAEIVCLTQRYVESQALSGQEQRA